MTTTQTTEAHRKVIIATIGKGNLRHSVCSDGITTKCGKVATTVRESEHGANCHRCHDSRRV